MIFTGSTIDLSRENRLTNAPTGRMSGAFDLLPAGAGRVTARIGEIRPVKALIDAMVS
jgi:hypothetical protein